MSAPKSVNDRPLAFPEYTDAELGLQMLHWYIQAAAPRYGAITGDAIDGDFAVAVQAQILRCEFDDSIDARLQKALILVVNGAHARSGRIFRELVTSGAISIRQAQFVSEELSRRNTARQKGGRATGSKRRTENMSRDKDIRRDHADLLKNGTDPRNVVSKLAMRHRLSARRIREIIGRSEKTQS